MAFKNQTIWYPTSFRTFEYRTNWVFKSPLYSDSFCIYILDLQKSEFVCRGSFSVSQIPKRLATLDATIQISQFIILFFLEKRQTQGPTKGFDSHQKIDSSVKAERNISSHETSPSHPKFCQSEERWKIFVSVPCQFYLRVLH